MYELGTDWGGRCLEHQIVERNLIHRQRELFWLLDEIYLEFPPQFVELKGDREVFEGIFQANSKAKIKQLANMKVEARELKLG